MKYRHQRRSFFELLEELGEDAWQQCLRTGKIFVSAKFWHGLGYDPALLPLTRQAALRLIHAVDLKLAEEEVALHVCSEKTFELEIRVCAASGEWRFLRLRGCVIETDAAGLPRSVAGSIMDLTGLVDAARKDTLGKAMIGTLSKRERQVLDCLIAGAANKNIASGLNLSIRTIEGYRARVLDKLGVRGTAELVRIALAAGVTPGEPAECGMSARAA